MPLPRDHRKQQPSKRVVERIEYISPDHHVELTSISGSGKMKRLTAKKILLSRMTKGESHVSSCTSDLHQRRRFWIQTCRSNSCCIELKPNIVLDTCQKPCVSRQIRGKRKKYAEDEYDCWNIGSVVGFSFLHACQTFCCFAKYWVVYSYHFPDCTEIEVRERYGRTPRSSATCRTRLLV